VRAALRVGLDWICTATTTTTTTEKNHSGDEDEYSIKRMVMLMVSMIFSVGCTGWK